MRNYVNFLLSKAGEKFIKNKSEEVFYCKDPNCPHCAYDENTPLVSDEEIYKASFAKESPIWHDGFIEGAKWMRSQYED